ncbi:MAG TPA: pyruvate ferredoxin oxidoreductase [Thermoplasmata archaeon]
MIEAKARGAGGRRMVTGDFAAAWGAKVSRPQVIAAYPITPQTMIIEHLSEFLASGELDAEMMRVESEHSALSAVIAAEATGVRTYTATSSQGLALMHEPLFIAPPMHLPIVMSIVNRTVAAPLGIWVEHNDTMPQRDTGWMQAYVEDAQEALDMVLQGYRIAEHPEIELPIMIGMDAFLVSHTIESVDLPDQEAADRFLPPFEPLHVYLDPDRPLVLGAASPPEYIQEVRWETDARMRRASEVLEDVDKEFGKAFGRSYGGAFETYRLEDADVGLVTLGTVTSTARDVVDRLRAAGEKVGLLKLRFFRPFPERALREATSHLKALGVYDRAVSYGVGGPTYIEVRNALYESADIPVVGFLAGLGGRDVKPEDVEVMFKKTGEAAGKGRGASGVHWIGTRGVSP